jgi:hypothetical protein
MYVFSHENTGKLLKKNWVNYFFAQKSIVSQSEVLGHTELTLYYTETWCTYVHV